MGQGRRSRFRKSRNDKKSGDSETVEYEFKGRVHKGSFTLSSGMVHVSSMYGRKSTQLGGTPVHLLAQSLMREIIHEADADMTLR